MNFLINLFSIFYSPDHFFKGVKNQNFEKTSLFFIFLMFVSLLSTFYGILNINFFLLFLLIVVFSSFILFFLIKIYAHDLIFKKYIISYVYSLFPLTIIYVLISFVNNLYNFITLDKPFILLVIAYYFVFLLVKGLKIISNVKSGFTYSAVALFIVYAYVVFIQKFDVVIFYSIVLFILYMKKRNFDAQGIVLLYRSKLGLKSMDTLSAQFPKTLNVLSWIGIYLGFLFMVAMVIFLIDNAIKLTFIPGTLPAVAPVLPGIPIPGVPFDFPLGYGILSIFITVVVHEFSHGVIARLHKIKVKSSGLFFMGPIIGAFIEPDDKNMEKKSTKAKLAVLGAGPFSNVLLALLVFLLLTFALVPLINSTVYAEGVKIDVLENEPAELHGLFNGMVINQIDNVDIILSSDLYDFLENTKPNQEILIYTEEETFNVTLIDHPEKENTGYLGITAVQNYILKDKFIIFGSNILLNLLLTIQQMFFWLFVISLGVGVANLLPFGPADGGKMLYYILLKFVKEEKAKRISANVSVFTILLLLFILFFPLFRWISSQFII
jgi:membrane-associated protease RseP (regulator of RpoE activity)